MNTLQIGTQQIFAGQKALGPAIDHIKTYSKRPLIVTDEGIVKIGVVKTVVEELKKQGLSPVVFDQSQPNPSYKDVIGIAEAFVAGDCDAIIGLGGGGPLDAAKGGAALVGQKRLVPKFDFRTSHCPPVFFRFQAYRFSPLIIHIPFFRSATEKQGAEWISSIRPWMGTAQKHFSNSTWKSYVAAVPPVAGIPTTSGTGSEGGKSAVIINTSGVKMVFGNPVFMPKTVALVPQFTQKLPPTLTAATGIDALLHNMEALFVTKSAAYNDGMNDDDIKVTDDFAVKGIDLIVKNLPAAVKNGDDLQVRLNMQIAALYGAKAFRKGDLGGVHATAHALGAYYHIHHGTAIARMTVPVLEYDQPRASEETLASFKQVHNIFTKGGYAGETLAQSTKGFFSSFGIPLGLKELPVKDGDIDKLSSMAASDPCQTNPVPLKLDDYKSIFTYASKM
jgi:alcohol dehydrogenase class IV